MKKWGKRARRTSTTLQTTKQTMKKASNPPMTNDDVVPSEDDDIWATFDDRQGANVITSNVLPHNLVRPIAGTSRSNMAHASLVNVMLLALGHQTSSQ